MCIVWSNIILNPRKHLFNSQCGCLGPLTGGSPCHKSILRNNNDALSNLRNDHVTLSILRNCHVPCHYLLKAMSHVTKPQIGPCRRVEFRGLGSNVYLIPLSLSHPESNPFCGHSSIVSTAPPSLTGSRGEYLKVVGLLEMVD